jgi:hypothetical protein
MFLFLNKKREDNMKKGNTNRISLLTAFAFIILISSNVTRSQNTPLTKNALLKTEKSSDTISTLAEDLETKLNLNEAQTNSVKTILVDYLNDIRSNSGSQRINGVTTSQRIASSKIEAMLNSAQATVWTSVQNNWWSEVRNVLGSGV